MKEKIEKNFLGVEGECLDVNCDLHNIVFTAMLSDYKIALDLKDLLKVYVFFDATHKIKTKLIDGVSISVIYYNDYPIYYFCGAPKIDGHFDKGFVDNDLHKDPIKESFDLITSLIFEYYINI